MIFFHQSCASLLYRLLFFRPQPVSSSTCFVFLTFVILLLVLRRVMQSYGRSYPSSYGSYPPAPFSDHTGYGGGGGGIVDVGVPNTTLYVTHLGEATEPSLSRLFSRLPVPVSVLFNCFLCICSCVCMYLCMYVCM